MTDPRELLDQYGNLYSNEPATGFKRRAAPKAFAALHLVLNIHAPVTIEHGWDSTVDIKCGDCWEFYPCVTVHAITTALEATDA